MTRRPLIYLSYFMFTADLRPGDAAYSETLIRHAHAMRAFGYDGFDLPIAAGSGTDHAAEVEQYRRLADRFAAAGLDGVGFTTNVGATPAFDPTSPDAGTRAAALAYLKSRVEITAVLGGGDTIMAGPFLYPYAAWPSGADGAPLWSDALQDWLAERYPRAVPVFEELAGFAAARGVKLAIEPVDH